MKYFFKKGCMIFNQQWSFTKYSFLHMCNIMRSELTESLIQGTEIVFIDS